MFLKNIALNSVEIQIEDATLEAIVLKDSVFYAKSDFVISFILHYPFHEYVRYVPCRV